MKKNIIKTLSTLFVISIIILGGIWISDTNKNQDQLQNDPDLSQDNNQDLGQDSNQDHNLGRDPDNNPDKEPPMEFEPSPTPAPKEPIVLAFAGDINFDENSRPMARYDGEQRGIAGGISDDLIHEMKSADIMMLNNEFAYSTRGTKTPNKSYTFRADPSRVDILHEMGVDIVSLANNHALDYGPEALLDTFETLDNAGIDYVGAGSTLERAKAAVYYTIGDTTIAFLSASRVIFAMDWYATDTRPGMIGTYDPAILLECIEEAKQNSDVVIVYVHWGVEKNHDPENYQKVFAKSYIDAGADAVIGAHPHVMQGIELYKGKPIAYSLGNYWFNSSTRESGLLKLTLDQDLNIQAQLLPVMNENTYTYLLEDREDKLAYYNFMEEISFNVTFDEDGNIMEKQD